MKAKIFGLFALSIFALVFLMGAVSAATLAEWPLTSDGVAINVGANVNAGTFTSSGVVFNAFGTNGANAENWSLTSSLNSSKYFEVTISPQTGNNLTISSIDFDYSGSTTVNLGSFELQYSKQSGFSFPTTLTTKTDVNKTEKTSSNSSLNIQVNSGETLTLRWFGYDFNVNTNEFRVKNLNIQGTVTEEEISFCDSGTIGDDDLTLKVDIENKGEGEDYEWLPLDTIEVDVELENDKNIDLDDIIFEIGFFKENSDTNIMDDMIWISDDDEEFEYGDIDENDDGKHTFEFRIDPDEVDSGDYLLMVKAYPQGEEDETCIDHSSDIGDDEFGPSEYYAKIEITKESDRDKMIIVDVSEIDTPIKAACGEQIVLSVDIWNIGNRDFEDQIMVSLYNSALGIDLKEVILGDLDEGDKAQVDFVFNVPTDANEKQYTLSMRTYYDYDEGDGKYETDYDRKSEDAFHAYLKVEGNCGVDSEVLISASLESEAKAGKEMIMSVLLTNTADVTRSFTMEASGYDAWAELSELPGLLTLNADSVGEALFKFDIKKGISGEQTFLVMVYSDNKLIATQPVSVNVESARPFLGITGLVTTDNAYLWGIGLLNIILIIIIILIAVRIARRK